MEEPQRPPEAGARRGIWASVPPKVRLLILSQALNGFTFGYFGIFVTAYLPQTGLSAFLVGILLFIEGFVAILASIPLAIRSDRRGRKGNVILGSTLFAPAILVFALTNNLVLFGLAAAVGGIGEAMAISSWNALIADLTDVGNRDSAFSFSFLVGAGSGSLGAVLPLAFPAVEAFTGMSSAATHAGVLLVLGVANFATPLMLWSLLRNHREAPRLQSGGLKLGGMGKVLRFSLCNGIIGFGAGLIIPLLLTWLWFKFDVPDTYSGPYFALAGLTIAFAAIGSPGLSRKMGLFPAILTTQLSSTVFMLSLAFIPNVFVVGGVYLVRAALMNMNQPLMDSFLMGITPPERRGIASTLNAIIWRVPNFGSTIIGGLILNSALFNVPALGISHLDLPWVIATGFYVVGAALLFVNFRNVKPNR